MALEYLKPHYGTLAARVLADGSFALRAGGTGRPDATAWAVLAIRAAGKSSPLIDKGCGFLQTKQLDDGRVPVDARHGSAAWPTALAILAWKNQGAFADSQKAAVDFLLSQKGRRGSQAKKRAATHDPNLIGWPWIQNTYSWVAPTSLAVTALRMAGVSDHGRINEARKMLLDRQLDTGGWNYGNKMVLGAKLRPMAETTGMALIALRGLVKADEVQSSLDYLNREAVKLRTPISLGWGLLGLAAWGQAPPESQDYIRQTLDRQNKFGAFDTGSLATLLVAALSPQGLLAMLGA